MYAFISGCTKKDNIYYTNYNKQRKNTDAYTPRRANTLLAHTIETIISLRQNILSYSLSLIR